MSLVSRHAALSDIGLHRETNEDAFVAAPPLFAVADGMGGAQAGEVASGIAVDTLRELVPAGRPLADAAGEANARIFARAGEHAERAGMGTTLTALVVDGRRGRFVHIGDSRAYLLRDGELRQLSDDHSLVGEWLREGAITPEEAAVNRYRSILSRALGTDDHAELDEFEVALRPGDALLLCSDGLSGSVSPEFIASALAAADPDEAVQTLIAEAKRHGGHDNITALVVRFEEGAGAEGNAAPEVAAADPDEAAAPGGDGAVSTAAAGDAAGHAALAARAGDSPSAAPATAAAAAGDGADAPQVTHWRRRLLIAGIIIAILLVGLSLTLNQVYYVGVSDGYVAVYRGVPWDVAGVGIHKVYLRTTTRYDQLTAPDKHEVDAHHLGSRGTAMNYVAGLGGAP